MEKPTLQGIAAKNIIRILEEKNISKAELGRRIGKSRSIIVKYLSSGTEKRNIDVDVLGDIAEALEVEPEELLRKG